MSGKKLTAEDKQKRAEQRRLRKEYQESMMAWYDDVMAAWAQLSDEEREEAMEWQKLHVDGSGMFGSSDWPGLAKYGVGPRPLPPFNPKFAEFYLKRLRYVPGDDKWKN